jgi:hypothetical protein
LVTVDTTKEAIYNEDGGESGTNFYSERKRLFDGVVQVTTRYVKREREEKYTYLLNLY